MYRPDPVPDGVLLRILRAGHAAGSVGMMQPWNFLVLRDQAKRQAVHRHFVACNERAAAVWSDERQVHYGALKLQGILDSPLNVVITCDHTRGGKQVLGRHTIPETDVYSTCLAVQNLWLAARSEGIGMGWLSIMEPSVVKQILGIPEHVTVVAYMTVGYPVAFPEVPLLEAVGWRQRTALDQVVFEDAWGAPYTHPPGANPAAAQATPAAAGSNFSMEAAQARQDALTKPRGSLGALEAVALQVCALQQTARPVLDTARLFLLAGDHGVSVEHVSAYVPQMTAKMVIQFVSGGGAVNAVARENGIQLTVADFGVDHDFSLATGVVDAKVRRGTRNLAVEPAMTHEECEAALAQGRALLAKDPPSLAAVGEMGIGNSTAAAALACALLELDPAAAAGIGTGIGSETQRRKAAVLQRALDLHSSVFDDPLATLAALGGFEIAGLVGVLLEAEERSIPVVLDGFITGAAALVAVRVHPAVRRVLIAGTRSAEPAHPAVLAELGLDPLLDLGIRIGEGAAAALAVPLVRSACRTLAEMSTFEEAGIPEPLDPVGRR